MRRNGRIVNCRGGPASNPEKNGQNCYLMLKCLVPQNPLEIYCLTPMYSARRTTGGFYPRAKQAIGAGIKGLGKPQPDFVPGISRKGKRSCPATGKALSTQPTKIHGCRTSLIVRWQTVKRQKREFVQWGRCLALVLSAWDCLA